MVQRLGQCYGSSAAIAGGSRWGSTPQPQPASPAPKKKTKKKKKVASKGSHYVPYQPNKPADAKPVEPARTRPKPDPSPPPSGGVPGGVVGGSLGGDVADDAAGMAPPPEAFSSEPEPMADVATNRRTKDSNSRADRKRERQERRAERKAKREAKSKTSDVAQSAPAAESEEAFDRDFEQDTMIAVEPEPDPDDQYHDWGAAIYLSNDDTMSLSSAQRVIFAIEHFLPLPLEHIRPHELLNYFSFEGRSVAPADDFSIHAEIAPHPQQQGIYSLALNVRGRPMDLRSRRNANLTLVVDRSGSMSDEGRMDFLKRGLHRMVSELKAGDIVNLVVFDHRVCTPLENFVVGRDSMDTLRRAIGGLRPQGSTNLHSGLTTGYGLADRSYQPTYTNRVVLVTDALANTGVTDPQMMSIVSRFYDQRRIRLSGVGVGRQFNDALLDRLTEQGRGAYVFLGSEAEVDAVFGPRFISLIETTANDVHFRLHLPPSLRMNVFYGEESSVIKEDVQAIHYFANTSQLFLSDLMARRGRLRPQDWVMLTIEYEDPETGQKLVHEEAFNLGDVSREGTNVRKAQLLTTWVDSMAELASRPNPGGFRNHLGGWVDDGGWTRCEEVRMQLQQQGQGLSDPEVPRVLKLWEQYCARYERPRNPVRRTPQPTRDAWPGASGTTR